MNQNPGRNVQSANTRKMRRVVVLGDIFENLLNTDEYFVFMALSRRIWCLWYTLDKTTGENPAD